MGFGAATPPREVFLVGFGGEAAQTNQKRGREAHPYAFTTSFRHDILNNVNY
jgi:hypothetical protein